MELGTPVPSRHEKSLGVLTMKFVSLLQQAEDGVLDLKVVSGTATSVGFGCFFFFFNGVLSSHPPDSRCEQKAVSHKCTQSGALICGTGGLA